MADTKMTWDEMVQEYPEQWVAVKDAEMDGPDIVSGILVAAKTDDDIIPFRIAHFDDDLIYRRTTEGEFHGIIDADFIISVN